jgi:hypothetical protein
VRDVDVGQRAGFTMNALSRDDTSGTFTAEVFPTTVFELNTRRTIFPPRLTKAKHYGRLIRYVHPRLA